jgi:hypothetical protein
MFAMKKIKITKAELEMVQEAADRLARRTGERFVINRNALEVVAPNITTTECADDNAG